MKSLLGSLVTGRECLLLFVSHSLRGEHTQHGHGPQHFALFTQSSFDLGFGHELIEVWMRINLGDKHMILLRIITSI